MRIGSFETNGAPMDSSVVRIAAFFRVPRIGME